MKNDTGNKEKLYQVQELLAGCNTLPNAGLYGCVIREIVKYVAWAIELEGRFCTCGKKVDNVRECPNCEKAYMT